MINTHVTAPGAILALGLMYLKTNNRYVFGVRVQRGGQRSVWYCVSIGQWLTC